jgi:hypothetical protein
VYPHRSDLHAKRFWLCAQCDAYCGCHPDGSPLGMLANADLRAARREAHAAFDPLWRRGAMTRSQAYAWLARGMGLDMRDCHVGRFDAKQCARVIELCEARLWG